MARRNSQPTRFPIWGKREVAAMLRRFGGYHDLKRASASAEDLYRAKHLVGAIGDLIESEGASDAAAVLAVFEMIQRLDANVGYSPDLWSKRRTGSAIFDDPAVQCYALFYKDGTFESAEGENSWRPPLYDTRKEAAEAVGRLPEPKPKVVAIVDTSGGLAVGSPSSALARGMFCFVEPVGGEWEAAQRRVFNEGHRLTEAECEQLEKASKEAEPILAGRRAIFDLHQQGLDAGAIAAAFDSHEALAPFRHYTMEQRIEGIKSLTVKPATAPQHPLKLFPQSPAEISMAQQPVFPEPAGGPNTHAIPGQPGEVPSSEQAKQAMREFIESDPDRRGDSGEQGGAGRRSRF